MTNEIEELEALWAAGPEEIFLQVTGDTGLPIASEGDWDNNPEITWCADRIYNLDAPYVRKDKYTTLLQSLKDKDAEIERRILERLPMRLRVEVKHVLDGTKPEILRND